MSADTGGKAKVGRNDPCPCGSGKKYKQCHLGREVAAGTTASRRPETGSAAELLATGRAHRAAGRLPQARTAFEQALRLDPTSVDAQIALGIASFEAGALDDAAAAFEKATKLRPELSSAHNNLGRVLLDQGKAADAEASFRKAVKLDARNAIALLNLGNAIAAQAKSDEAIGWYEKAIAQAPDAAATHYNLANAFKACGRLDEAIASYRRALSLEADFADALNNLGAALQETGKLDEATSVLRKALALAPDFAEAQFNLSTLLVGAGDEKGAIRCLERAAAASPDDGALHFHLGALLERAGDDKGAAKHFRPLEKGTPLDRARLDAWRYMRAVRPAPKLLGSPIDAFRMGLAAARKDGLVLEFGVRFGASIRQIAALAGQDVHGFDSFQGLPEAWHDEARGSYSTKGVIPKVPANVTLHDGWFEKTLPPFVAKHAGPVRFVNVDCDLYSSTKTVLDALATRIGAGTVIVFDEYVGHEFWREDEYRAFQEAVAKHRWRYEYLGFSMMTKQAVVRIA